VELKIDGGEGRNFNESFGFPGGHREIRLSQRNIFAGGDVRFPSSSSLPLVDQDFENGNKEEHYFVFELEIFQHPSFRMLECSLVFNFFCC